MQLEAIDVIDRKIIDQLRLDGRRSFGQIARYVGLSEASVRQRYKRLLDLGVVQVIGMPNSPKLGLLEVRLSIRVRGTTVDAVAHALSALSPVKYVGACIGAYDLIVDVRCETQTELTAFLTDTLHTIPGIAVVDTTNILEVIKDEYLWSGFRDPVGRLTRPHPSAGSRPSGS
ncbi:MULTISPECIES: Lrp/AsnC family transcriptional regulator [Actinomycetes]|uniref:Lrp/AsnC family transcriptional regulator n=1 Tax=Actinomycetes TaxID=1760 RepID=UPI00197BE75B|nr:MULTISPECIES: Lrp/AsnC family transcriptional regulator [Actinomycetes]